MEFIKKLRLTSGHIIIADSSNTHLWMEEKKNTEHLHLNHGMDETLYKELVQQGKNEVVYFNEILPYILTRDFSHYKIDEDGLLAVTVNTHVNEIAIYEERDVKQNHKITVSISSKAYNNVKNLGYVSIDGAHLIVTDIQNMTLENLYTGEHDKNEFFIGNKGYWRWLSDGLSRVDGYYHGEELIQIIIQELDYNEETGDYDLEYGKVEGFTY